MSTRRKASAIQRDFLIVIDRLRKFDSENQKKFSHSNPPKISKNEMFFSTESIFITVFREFENFIRDVFLFYCLGKSTKSRRKIKSYLHPNDLNHAERLIQSSLQFLDWNSPDSIIDRAEIYLEDGYPIKLPFTTHLNKLREYKKIRNHIAHNSTTSFKDYIKVLTNHYPTLPLRIPKPGEFLLETEPVDITKYKLQYYFDLVINIAKDII